MPSYVRQSAKLKCSMGSAQSALQLSHPTNSVLLCGSYMAGIMDIKSMANLAPFGLCKSLANPTVAAATAAASGKLQKMPCVPCVASPWAYGKTDVFVKGMPAVMKDSRCVCMWLGIIKVEDAGQKSVVDTAPPPFIAAEPEPAPEAKTAGAPPPLPKGGVRTPKKGLLASIAAAATAAIGGVFGRQGKGGDAEAAASPDVTPIKESMETTKARKKTASASETPTKETPVAATANTPATAKPTPTSAATDKPATTAPAASSKSADGTQKALVVGVTGPQDASVGQKVEYQAVFNIDNVSDADRKKVTWAVSFPGIWPVEKGVWHGDKITIEIKNDWHREDILVYARMKAFERNVSQRTSIDPDIKTANANRATVCASCDMKNSCRFKESKYGYIIGDAEFDDAAKRLGIEVELMKAIGEKESRGIGFRRVGQSIILFERHKMHKHLVATNKYSSAQMNDFVKKYPDVVNTDAGRYNISSYEKLKTAKTIDVACAIKSCSWGRFQVMGENFRWGNYSSPEDLELAMNACDLQQFKYFVAFLEKKIGMRDALLTKNWEKIADCYNGAAWREKNPTYAGDIKNYYYKFKNNPTKT